MTWIVRVPNGPEVESDDFTLADMEQLEKESGQPWSIANPLRDVKVAKAFLRIAYAHAGRGTADVDALTLRTLKTQFDHRADEPWPGDDDGEDDAAPLDQSSQPSSPGASAPTTGPRRKRGSKP